MQVKSPYQKTLLVCLAEVFGLASIAAFPALLPTFQAQWVLSNTQAGWINAGYFAGYMVLVPVLLSITDRIDARKIMGLGAVFGTLSAIGYALLAQGFWSAFFLRVLAGMSLAGIYMPGLKIVSDNTESQGSLQSRFVSFYTASFAIGSSLSYLLAGEINRAAGWKWAFFVSAISTALSLVMIIFVVPPAHVGGGEKKKLLSGFKIVLKSKAAMAYVLGYAAHMWELFSMRSWIVAFLVFSIDQQPAGTPIWSATQVAFIVNLIGLPSSIAGNEFARKYGRKRVISIVMIASALLAAILGFSPTLPYLLVAFIAIVYGVTIVGDSASLTAGVVAAAPEGHRGATLAVHSTIGFFSAFLGPLAVGAVLDAFGGGRLAWGMGFICMACGCLMGPLLLKVFGPKESTP